MKEDYKKTIPIWDQNKELSRKWVYPTCLTYETSIPFFGYPLSVHHYLINQHLSKRAGAKDILKQIII